MSVMRWLVDGYNVIRRAPELRSREQESLEAGRQALCAMLAEVARVSHDIFTVVFDGVDAGGRGGGGEGRRRRARARAAQGQSAEAQQEGTGDAAGPRPPRAGETTGPLAAFLDQAIAALQIAVADRAVEIDRRLFDALEEIEVERAIVDGIAHLHGEGGGPEGGVVVERVDRPVDPRADAVTAGERRGAGEHEVRSRPGNPEP